MSFLRNNRVLWVLQILLAALYLVAGGFKLFSAPEGMVASPTDPIPAGNWLMFLRLIGGFEVLGALGLVLPGLTGIKRHLTPIAAGCLAIIMVGAVVIGARQQGAAAAIMPLVAGILDLVVMRGRKGWAGKTEATDLTTKLSKESKTTNV
jgi:uncharacterized membrane protein YphA (DoxX/SURF4 family)